MKKRDHIISKVKLKSTRYLKKNDNGIKLPKNMKEARILDKENGNTLWQDAIAKELANVSVAFKIMGDNESTSRGCHFLRCLVVFDIKMEDFRRKARLVASGHMTKKPAAVTYASVVSRETVRIALTIAALNELGVKVGDVMNTYNTAPCTERILTTLGPEFGADAGKNALIVRALYGLKSSGAAFRKHLGECMGGGWITNLVWLTLTCGIRQPPTLMEQNILLKH